MKAASYGLLVATLLGISITGPQAQSLRNTITLDNQSGEPALVKLIGPTRHVVEVRNGQQRTLNVAAGDYYLLARYGNNPNRYTYSRGDPFKVEEMATQHSFITITLHKVVGGNYPTRPTSSEEFDKTVPMPKSSDAEAPFAIKDDRFIDRSWPPLVGAGTNLELFEKEGSLYVRGNYSVLPGGKQSFFVPSAVHTWMGKATLYGYIFDSDKEDPLQFSVHEDKGYVYVKGKGTVTMPDGRVIKLPSQ